MTLQTYLLLAALIGWLCNALYLIRQRNRYRKCWRGVMESYDRKGIQCIGLMHEVVKLKRERDEMLKSIDIET